jgi:putative cardiolipin synthase
LEKRKSSPGFWPGVELAVLVLLQTSCSQPRLLEPPAVTSAFDQPTETQLGRLAEPLAAAHPGETGLVVLRTGLDAFAARVRLIERAERAIDLQVYIFHGDVTGKLLLHRLLAAADRGVRVRLLLDDMGSAGIDDLIAAADLHPGLEIRLFNGFARGPLPGLARMLDMMGQPRLLNHRMHNKLLLVDGAAGVVGGRNVGDEYFDASENVNFADLDLMAFGPVAPELGASFDLYWNCPHALPLSAWRSLNREAEDLALLRAELESHLQEQRGSPYEERLRASDMVKAAMAGELSMLWAPAHAVADLPEKITARDEEVAATLLVTRMGALLPEAQNELTIVSPYFVPREKGIAWLSDAAKRGVRVRILTNSLAATDVAAVHAGYAPARRPLLESGVEIYELRPRGERIEDAHSAGLFGSSQASLHAKTFTIDKRIVFVGSLNLDPRSVVLNTEIGLIIDSQELAALLNADFEELTSAALSYAVGIGTEGESSHLVWRGEEAGAPVILESEPGTSWWLRWKVGFLSLLPIQGQL